MTSDITTEANPYTIRLHGINLTIYPQGDGVYSVYKESRQIAHIHAESVRGQQVWESEEWVDEDYINEIGEKILEYEAVHK